MAQPAREKGGKVVFIGNIPYGVSEEQICEIFGRVGAVVNFRLVYDKDTGRPKGFGFLEYTDVDAAASAVRNLDSFELMGRTLRVDYSNDNGGGNKQNDQRGDGHHVGGADGQVNGAPPPGALPPLPQGVELAPGVSAPDAISQTISALPPAQLLDFISQMKGLVSQNPAQAAQLLQSAPQLSYAAFQAMLLLGLVEANQLRGFLEQDAQQQQQPAHQPAPPMPGYAQQPPQHMMQPPQPAYPPQPLQPPYGAPPSSVYTPYGAPQPQAYAPTPPAPQPAYQPPAPQPAEDPQAAQLRQTILGLTREQIFGLDPVARDQILTLRAQYGAPVS